MKKHLIIGDPIEHSLSPKIHNYWFKKNDIQAVYEKKKISFEEIKNIIQNVKDGKIYGMNVTVPFKQKVIQYLDSLSPLAKKTNSVNTIFNKDGKTYGDNTDIIGFELSILDSNVDLKNKSALIFGAGGVVPSIIVALQNLGLKEINISNRTTTKIETIKKNFSFINDVEWGNLGNYDIYINATSVGLNNDDNLNLNFSKLDSNRFYYDVIYNPKETNFLIEAKKKGNLTENGKKLFIYQASR